jgi:anti-anti-sigma regulatory factor
MTAQAERLPVRAGLDVESRRVFIENAIDAVGRAAGSNGAPIDLDCSQIDALDETTLGMLVMVARAAQRRGTRVAVTHASERLRADLDGAGATHFFDLR